jgi:hypothetical protein
MDMTFLIRCAVNGCESEVEEMGEVCRKHKGETICPVCKQPAELYEDQQPPEYGGEYEMRTKCCSVVMAVSVNSFRWPWK